jgi:hypothetical protein
MRYLLRYENARKQENVVPKLKKRLVEIIAKLTRHACRQGEAGNRKWPELEKLILAQSWICVGEIYADQVLAELLEVALQNTPRPRKIRKLKSTEHDWELIGYMSDYSDTPVYVCKKCEKRCTHPHSKKINVKERSGDERNFRSL